MKLKGYELTLQFLSRDETDGGFIAEAYVIVRLLASDLELPFEQFVERYLQPAWMQAKAEHDRLYALVEEAMKREAPAALAG